MVLTSIPKSIQNIVGGCAKRFLVSLGPEYDYEDLMQEGCLKWCSIKDTRTWESQTHFNRVLYASVTNHFKNLYNKKKSQRGLTVVKIPVCFNTALLKINLQSAPTKIAKIERAILKVIERGLKLTNKNVCKELGWSAAHVNAVTLFKDFLLGRG